jgi:hypothetical protein
MNTDSLARFEAPYIEQLSAIGASIGYGRAQQILGEHWDHMLQDKYGVSDRGAMGVSIRDMKPVGKVVIGPKGDVEGWTVVQWDKDGGCPAIGSVLYVIAKATESA